MAKQVFAYLQTHWDREWYKTFEQYRLRLIDDIFQKIESKEIPSFYLDGQTVALDDYLEIYPEKKAYVMDLIKKQKLFVGPFYALADECLVNGESLARNLLIGINSSKNYLAKDFTGYLPDAFGHCAWMPMLFKKTNIKNAIVWRGVEDEMQEFSWISPDGSDVRTTYLAAGYFQDFFAKKSYKKNINNLLTKLDSFSGDRPILLPIGADHLGCEDNIKAKIKNFNRDNKKFHIKLSSLNEYFQTTNKNTDLKSIYGELRSNSHSSVLPSVFSSRIYLKQHNMHSQWLLGKISEPLYAIGTQNGILKSKQNSFDYAWKKLIQNQAHDSICGCSLDEVHRENVCRYEKIEQLCNTAIDMAKFELAKQVANNELLTINLSNFDFEGVYSFYSSKKLDLPIVNKIKAFPIEISQDIHNIPVQENYTTYYEYLAYSQEIPALSFISSKPQKNKGLLKITTNSLENNRVKIEVNADGSLNLTNKITNKEFKNIHKITDDGDVGDSYNFSPTIDNQKLIAKFEKSQIIENNDLRKKLRLTYTLKVPTHAIDGKKRSSKLIKHYFETDIAINLNSPRIDFEINYKNLSKDHIFKLNFGLEKEITTVLSEDVFGTATRTYNPEYDYKKLLPAPKGVELNLNISCLQRFVSTQGFTILTKGLQEYEVDKNNLNITLLRCFDRISRKNLSSRGTAAGPPLPTPEGQCLGQQKAEYAILLSDNINEIFKQADYFYNPLVVCMGTGKNSSINKPTAIKLPDGLYLYNIKQAENREGNIIKIFNYSKKIQHFKINNYKTIYETNLLEEISSKENLFNKHIEINPNELKILFIQ